LYVNLTLLLYRISDMALVASGDLNYTYPDLLFINFY